MDLFDLGLTDEIKTYIGENNLSGFSVARVTQEHRERYIVTTGDNEYEAEITGNLRFSAQSRADFPAVGDWVSIMIYDSDQALIHKVLPRKSILERQAVGKFGEVQIISTNIDVAFIMQAINNNYNINRLERYMSLCNSSNIEPVLVLSKTDMCSYEMVQEAKQAVEAREKNLKCIMLSNITLSGLDDILNYIQRGKTYCIVGSSGVGKSTLINNLLKKNVLKTGIISLSTNKGRHITSHRELFVLENGGIVIDTPGMKEIGMTENAGGIITTFTDIHELSLKCRFPDCRHFNETGCAVIEALNNGSIDKDSFDNYMKVTKEQERFQSTVAERRKKDKEFGKMMKNYKKDMKKNQDSDY
jgi:ribosome biogenesis GTPase / thiamine phosphate phosphatase